MDPSRASGRCAGGGGAAARHHRAREGQREPRPAAQHRVPGDRPVGLGRHAVRHGVPAARLPVPPRHVRPVRAHADRCRHRARGAQRRGPACAVRRRVPSLPPGRRHRDAGPGRHGLRESDARDGRAQPAAAGGAGRRHAAGPARGGTPPRTRPGHGLHGPRDRRRTGPAPSHRSRRADGGARRRSGVRVDPGLHERGLRHRRRPHRRGRDRADDVPGRRLQLRHRPHLARAGRAVGRRMEPLPAPVQP